MKITKTVNAAYVLYSPVNAAYFVMWRDQTLAVFAEKWEALAYFDDITR